MEQCGFALSSIPSTLTGSKCKRENASGAKPNLLHLLGLKPASKEQKQLFYLPSSSAGHRGSCDEAPELPHLLLSESHFLAKKKEHREGALSQTPQPNSIPTVPWNLCVEKILGETEGLRSRIWLCL